MALNAGASEPGWEPPPEAERKVLAARRERQERISHAMGEYLLRGYRMLGECCPDCGTILLQDKQRQLYCVACQELDSDADKDDPALSAQAALSQAREHQRAGASPGPRPAARRPEHCEGAAPPEPAAMAATAAAAPPPAEPGPPEEAAVLAAARAAVLRKLGWAARELPRCSSAEAAVQLCALVRACAEALRGLRGLAPP
ncbi:protein ZNRD2 [Dromaius novaehollandiae]|uniref:protein ZNRD2 n=1 Tax=Dromaius novaehollandiae TaxID=8790 RepID=UPI00311EFBB3